MPGCARSTPLRGPPIGARPERGTGVPASPPPIDPDFSLNLARVFINLSTGSARPPFRAPAVTRRPPPGRRLKSRRPGLVYLLAACCLLQFTSNVKTIAFISQRGVAGKSTLCVDLGVATCQRGYRTAIVDTDPRNRPRSGIGHARHRSRRSQLRP
jgi:Mrp family chromosome partitioning ATPase